MLVYHELQPDALGSVLKNGLKRTSRGDKGDDKAIIATDHFLDERCPKELKDAGVSRDDNIYAYVVIDESIIDIVNGTKIPLKEFIANSQQAVLELDIDPRRCFVSDLDTFDALKDAIENHKNQHVLDQLASSYWNKVVSLPKFIPDSIRRPEILITYDVQPGDIHQKS